MKRMQVTRNSGEKLSSCCMVHCLLESTVKDESYFTGKRYFQVILKILLCLQSSCFSNGTAQEKASIWKFPEGKVA